MKTKLYVSLSTLLVLFFIIPNAVAQQRTEQERRQEQLEKNIREENGDDQQGWKREVSIGLDFVSNLIINPTVGGGQNRLGISGSIDANLTYQKGRFSWYGLFSLNHGIQKVGSGLIQTGVDTLLVDPLVVDTLTAKVPFQKNIDNIWINSRASLRASDFSPFYYTADLFFNSQLTPTYQGNFLSDVNGIGAPVSQFLAPGILQLSTGVEYRPNDFVSFFLTPASLKTILVLNDAIADDLAVDTNGRVLGTIHGNPFSDNGDGTYDFKNVDLQLGAAFRMVYNNQLTDNILLNSNLLLFSDYLERPDHIDVNWRNELSITIFRGLKFSLLSLLTYDHDIFVQKTDNDQIGGVSGLGRRVNYIQQFLIKYTYAF